MGENPRRQQAAKCVAETLRVARMQFRGHMVMEERDWVSQGLSPQYLQPLPQLVGKLGLYLMRALAVT